MMDVADRPGGGAAPEWKSPLPELDFSRVLDDTCGRLLNKKAEFTIRKIRCLEKILAGYERELDEFLGGT